MANQCEICGYETELDGNAYEYVSNCSHCERMMCIRCYFEKPHYDNWKKMFPYVYENNTC